MQVKIRSRKRQDRGMAEKRQEPGEPPRGSGLSRSYNCRQAHKKVHRVAGSNRAGRCTGDMQRKECAHVTMREEMIVLRAEQAG